MRAKQRLEQLEKKLTELTGTPEERGTVIIIRSWLHGDDAALIGYRHGERILPLDRTQWPHLPAGSRMALREVWSDHDTYSSTEHLEQQECEQLEGVA